MTRIALICLFSVLATACASMDDGMHKHDGMMSDKMAKPAMENSMDKKMDDTKMMDGMEKKKEAPMMPAEKM